MSIIGFVAAFFSNVLAALPFVFGGHGGDLDTLAPFNRAGEPHNLLAMGIVIATLLVIVLGLATLISSQFNKKQ